MFNLLESVFVRGGHRRAGSASEWALAAVMAVSYFDNSRGSPLECLICLGRPDVLGQPMSPTVGGQCSR